MSSIAVFRIMSMNFTNAFDIFSKETIQIREWSGPFKTREASFLRNRLRRPDESAPCRPRQRTAHADPANAHRSQIRNLEPCVRAHQDIHRLWTDGRDDGLNIRPL